ncbi:MAG: hypothetical protein AMXMBFR84_48850 [Candidatus Hydrogenedentota bacterium]
MALFGKRSKQTDKGPVDPELIAKAFAKSVLNGDLVTFRILFQPYSPARQDSSESFNQEKYRYLLPDVDQENNLVFREALRLVKDPDIWQHIQQELGAKRPAQLPAPLVMKIADNAVGLGKYGFAAQAYELLRIRPNMRNLFFEKADAALDKGDIRTGVRGYIIAAGLEYDYSAFPEPLPRVLNFQNQAPILHAEYPKDIRDSLPLQEPESFVRTALTYLMADEEGAGRLESRPFEVRVKFLKELVVQRDPQWPEFVERFRQAAAAFQELARKRQELVKEAGEKGALITEELEEQMGIDPRVIPASLLGRTIENGEWWQYLKGLAYEHPPAILFVARQILGKREVLVPRLRGDSPVPKALDLSVQEI